MEDFKNSVMGAVETYGPPILKAVIIMVVAYIIARIVAWLVSKSVDATGFAKRANKTVTDGQPTLGKSLSAAGFWIVILFGMVQSFSVLGATQISNALNGVIDPIMLYLPKVVGALIVFGIFMIIASVVKRALKAILLLADGLPERFGMAAGPVNVSGIASIIAYGLIAIAGAIAAIEVLDVDAISNATTPVLNSFIGIIPNIVAAGLILGIFVLIARFAANMLRQTLPSTGLDGAVAELGVLKGADGGMTASMAVSRLAMFFLVLTGLTAALAALNIPALTEVTYDILAIAGNIAFGVFIIFVFVLIARMLSAAMAAAGSGANDLVAGLVKWVIIVFGVIIRIARMGLDPTGGEFVLNVAEYLVIGGAAALALAFGWGGKDWAARQLERFRPEDLTDAAKPARTTKTTK